jgi:hypothetical protein
VRITEIAFDGQRFTAPELPQRKPKAAPPVETEADAGDGESAAPKTKAAAPKKNAAKKHVTKPKAAKKTAKKASSSKTKKKR